MGDPHWTSYVGMITGIIGAISGISGAVLGVLGYRKSNSLKSLDLRLELRKLVNCFESEIGSVRELVENADKSRRAVASATGRSKSGSMEKWGDDVSQDLELISGIDTNESEYKNIHAQISSVQLELKLAEVHKLQVQLEKIKSKYEMTIKEDDDTRKHIKESMHNRFNE